MTVRLLAPYPFKSYITIPAGAIVGIFSAADEAGLIAAKLAEASSAAVTWAPPNEAPFFVPLTPAAAAAAQTLVSGAGTYINTNGALYGLVETTPYQTPAPTASTLLVTGPCELAGWFCSVAAGTITIYDALSATGTPIVPATALVVGPMPIFGAGTPGKLALNTGCFVVLSGAATVRVLVGT